MKNTFSFTIITTVFKNVLGFGLAIALNQKLKTKNALRAVYYLPVILSTLIIAEIFRAMLLPDKGIVSQFLGIFSADLAHFDWLGTKSTAMYMVMLVDIWKGAGYCMVIYLAGLQAVPGDCYEAATIDGATGWQTFWKITLPLMVSTVSTNVLLCIIGGLKVFDIIIAMTNGGPGMSTQVLNTTIYSYFGSGALSTGCAANVLLTILVVICFVIIKRIWKMGGEDGMRQKKIRLYIFETCLWLISLVVLLPLLLILVNALKTPAETNVLTLNLPQKWQFVNFIEVFRETNIIHSFLTAFW